MSIEIMEVEMGSSRGVSQISKNQLGLLNWPQYTHIKKSRLMDNILIKQL